MKKLWHKLKTRKQRVAARKARLVAANNSRASSESIAAQVEAIVSANGHSSTGSPQTNGHPALEVDVIVTPNEVNDRHGTGVLLMRLFGAAQNTFSIRTFDHYKAVHDFGRIQLVLAHAGASRPDSFQRVLDAVKGTRPKRVLCVPFFPDELVTAIALKEIFGIPLCVYVMDDSNICNQRIPDALMREALEKADLRLAISPEMRDAYERKYYLKFWLVPPVVAPDSILQAPQLPSDEALNSKTGILVGNVWSNEWLKLLRQTVKESGLRVHWFGNGSAPWLQCTKEALAADGIIDCGFIPEQELTKRLKNYAYALIPSGTLDQRDDRPEIAQLSLPTRLPYLLACSNTPMLVLGSPKSAAAQFVTRLNVGLVADYDSASLRCAVEKMCSRTQQETFRRNASQTGRVFSAEALGEWVWRSLDQKQASDNRFEDILPRSPADIVPYLEAPVPDQICGDFVPTHQMLRRLKQKGFTPDFILDVGASSGVWSDAAKRVFPKCRFVLIDPLGEKYRKTEGYFLSTNPDFEYVTAAISNEAGEAEFQVSPDHYNSTLLRPSDFRVYETIKVPVTTLDLVAADKKLEGRGLAKIDVQYSEHLVLAGAAKLLSQIDAVVLELSFVRYAPEAKLFQEMCELLTGLGYRYFDEAGVWRSPVDGTLLQKDVLFLREGFLPYRTSQ
jgi:FkbM family methyltransferase